MFDILEHKVEVFAFNVSCLSPLSNLPCRVLCFVNLFHLIIFIFNVTTDKQTNKWNCIRTKRWYDLLMREEVWNNSLNFCDQISCFGSSVCASRILHAVCASTYKQIKERRRRIKKCMYKHQLCYFFIWNSGWWCRVIEMLLLPNSWSSIIKLTNIFINVYNISDLNEISCILLKYIFWKLT